ncbi:hypothetical protein SOCEGT47_012630 [Sorangium cellulosum]|uniref:Lysyl oxidase-like protein n=1 Tax=Sorangium cellulosum TaxID=56 RepID=A0A4P2PVQ2_SORCE|nr:lysyl oxidase family protein [Sorangium cellulosum]AUX20789.1 hypothetical protein SOCEGT47_012630 [Sorangium cellulosum]
MKNVAETLWMGSWLVAVAAGGCGTLAGPPSGAGGSGGGGRPGDVLCAGSDLVCPGGARCQIDAEGEPSGCAAACDDARACGDAACCSPGAACLRGRCVSADLALEPLAGAEAVTFAAVHVGADACEALEGCVGGSGRRMLLRFNVALKNVGDVSFTLGAPSESGVFTPNFCEGSYVVPRFFRARLTRGDAVLAEGALDARCIAMRGGRFGCDAQGLAPGEHVAQPGTAVCNALDVTGVPAGRYALAITVNPDRAFAEARYDNNTLVLPVDYPACDGAMCGGACCPAGHACEDGVCKLPDLRPSARRIVDTLRFSYRTFPADACEILERCVGGPGRRHLLEFEGRIENTGPGHLDAGPERDNPLFEYAQCHQHYHFKNFTEYRLLGADGEVVAQGHKQAFCLLDVAPLDPAAPAPPGAPGPGSTGCNFLSAGWADVYEVGTPCQWIDVTDVPEGDYVLRVAVNPIGVIAERSTADNVVEVPVRVPAFAPCVAEPEICGDLVDQDCDGIADNGCARPACASPRTEVCGNGADENCNGIPDDGCAPIRGADRCETPGELTGSMNYAAEITAANTPDVALPCGGEGGEVFFRFTLPSEEVVYLSTLESDLDTALALLQGDGCGGVPLRCARDTCGAARPGANLAARLPAGRYTVVVKAVRPGATGTVRLKLERASCLGEAAGILESSGLLRGDSTGAPIPAASPCGASSPEESYYVPLCPDRPVTLSSCGLSEFPMRLRVAEDACHTQRPRCSTPQSGCADDPDAASVTLETQQPGGSLGAVTVSGRTPVDFGPYRIFVLY